jgi:preprotein translocase subunit SecD
VTGANIKKRLAIVLDRKVYLAPEIQVKIRDGRSRITGLNTMEEAKDLAIVLKAGALPAPVKIIEERTVGPSLGRDSVREGSYSAILGFITVALFMIIYYHWAGSMADLALIANVLFILAVMGYFNATLTLPGIAGIILTMGMAVDANVLINERIREEIRHGKTVKMAIDLGYSNAFRAILDSNVTTFIAGVVLYQFGTGSIRGFALTLMIGIISSMFTAIVITRLIYDYLIGKWNIQRLSI